MQDLWLEGYGGNSAAIAELARDTMISGGYYRADVSETVSVLVLNNEYFDDEADDSLYEGEQTEQLDWLEFQLSSAKENDRKYIIAGHVPAGVRY